MGRPTKWHRLKQAPPVKKGSEGNKNKKYLKYKKIIIEGRRTRTVVKKGRRALRPAKLA